VATHAEKISNKMLADIWPFRYKTRRWAKPRRIFADEFGAKLQVGSGA
jgi:hypothetical protein